MTPVSIDEEWVDITTVQGAAGGNARFLEIRSQDERIIERCPYMLRTMYARGVGMGIAIGLDCRHEKCPRNFLNRCGKVGF